MKKIHINEDQFITRRAIQMKTRVIIIIIIITIIIIIIIMIIIIIKMIIAFI